MKKFLSRIVPLFVLIFFIQACSEDEECRLDRYVVAYVHFYSVSISETGELNFNVLTTDSLTVYGLGIDSLLVDSMRVSSIGLPLNKFSTLSEFIFEINGVKDTVSIPYEVENEFLSFECGYLTTFYLDSLNVSSTNNYIDSLRVEVREVNTENVGHIKIYHTSQ